MSDTIVKQRSDAPDGFFEAEAAGLRWLAEAEGAGGARIARVVAVGPGRIELERIHELGASRKAALAFGHSLAATHRFGAEAFGAPPAGWDGPMFIGRRALAAAHETRWGAMYARDRVLPYLEAAEQDGSIRPDEARIVREACELIASGELDDDEPPSRIHGDLWNGNVLWSADGVVLIDPAAHGGHRETDLGMLQLFGVPFWGDVLAGYQEAWPLRTGWQRRVGMHQLHPLAVHTASFGRSYAGGLVEAALGTLALGRGIRP